MEDLALVLTGGGARAAYQVGVLSALARRFPRLRIPILSGFSAGAVNAAYLASDPGPFSRATAGLRALWSKLRTEDVFRVDAPSLARHVLRWGARLVSGGFRWGAEVRGLVDTTPLRRLLGGALEASDGVLAGIDQNVRRGALKAVAIGASSYSTGQSVVWVQGCCDIRPWTRPKRRGVDATLTVDHVMASAALPLFFPAVRVDGAWYGDGGIRLATPLSPAIHLGASRILAIATRFEGTAAEEGRPTIAGYPPPAQVMGTILNAIFLDSIDEDALRLRALNRALAGLAPHERDGLRVADLLVLRPSRDLGRLAHEYEPHLPRAFRFLTRGLGTRETLSSDMLSLLMFQPDYVKRLIEIGEADTDARADEIAAFLEGREEGGMSWRDDVSLSGTGF